MKFEDKTVNMIKDKKIFCRIAHSFDHISDSVMLHLEDYTPCDYKFKSCLYLTQTYEQDTLKVILSLQKGSFHIE